MAALKIPYLKLPKDNKTIHALSLKTMAKIKKPKAKISIETLKPKLLNLVS